jgi:hypothetical protein
MMTQPSTGAKMLAMGEEEGYDVYCEGLQLPEIQLQSSPAEFDCVDHFAKTFRSCARRLFRPFSEISHGTFLTPKVMVLHKPRCA